MAASPGFIPESRRRGTPSRYWPRCNVPELPEVEAVCRKLRKQATGAKIVSAHVQRLRITAPQDPAEVEARLKGRRIERIERRGKNILIVLSGGLTIRV